MPALLHGNGANAWFGWSDDPKIESRRQDWLNAPDLASQQRICRDLQVEALNDVLYVPVGEYYQHTAFKKNLGASTKKGFPIFRDVQPA